MVDVKTRLRPNRIVLLILGLWPYHQTTFTKFYGVLLSSILTSFIGVQFMGLLTIEHKSNVVVKSFTQSLFYIFCAIKYYSFWINSQPMKFLMDQLQCIFNELSDEHEMAILEKYGNIAKQFSLVFIYLTILIFVGLLCLPFGLYVSQAFLSINISQPRITSYFVTEYFVDEEKSFYFALVHIYIASFIGMLAIVAIGSFLLVCTEYSCGMLKIACYRIDTAMDTVPKNRFENVMLIYRRLILAIEMHIKAIKFCEFLVLSMEKSYFFYIIVLVSCMSLEFHQTLYIILYEYDFFQVIVHLGGACVLLIYLLVFNCLGQQVIDHNSHVYFTAYNIQWYKAPLPVQRLILFVLQSGSKEFRLNIGGIFMLSLEFWATLMGASLSYFTFMYNMHH